MKPTIAYLAAIDIVMFGLHVYVLVKMMPFRKDLLEDAHGVTRFRDFIAQPVRENYSASSYLPEGVRYLPWLRLTALVGTILLIATALSVAR